MGRATSTLRRVLVSAALFIGALIVAPDAVADLTPFASASSNCSGDSVSFPNQTAEHPNVIYSVTPSGASGYADGNRETAFNGGDEVWGAFGSVSANTPSQMYLSCDGGSATVQLYDRPIAPATFSGVASDESNGIGETWSYLPFTALGTGQYVADVTLDQGSIEVDGTTVASSEEVALGQLSAGNQDIPVYGRSGPPATYSLTIRELPVEVSGLTFGDGYGAAPSYAAPGTILTGSFSVSGETTITGYVLNAGGAIVRHLGSFAVSQGDSSVTWDARGDGGAALPDGTYYLKLDSTDPNGNVTRAETSIILDGIPPTTAMTSPGQISSSRAISFAVSDAESGVAGVSLSVDGQDVADYGNSPDGWYGSPLPPNGQFSYGGPWSLGTHTWEIVATDNVGNSTDATGRFVVANNAPPSAPSSGKPRSSLPSGVFAAGYFASFAHRPGTLALWASDALIRLHWTSWGGPIATAHGRETTHSHGRYTSWPAQVQLSRIAVCGGRRVYTHVRYRIVGQPWITGRRNGCRLSA